MVTMGERAFRHLGIVVAAVYGCCHFLLRVFPLSARILEAYAGTGFTINVLRTDGLTRPVRVRSSQTEEEQW